MTVAVLAGGRSSRFGSDKALARLSGRTLLRWILDRFRGRCGELLLVVDRRDRFAVPAGVRVVVDRFPGSGPLGGAHAALEEASRPIVACCAIDAPLLRAANLARLRAALGPEHGAAIFAREGFLQPFPCLLRADACREPARRILASYAAANGGAEGRAPRLLELICGVHPAIVEAPSRWVGARNPLTDLDTRKDLARTQRRLAPRIAVRPTADLASLRRHALEAGLEDAHEEGERLGAWAAFEGRRMIGGVALERIRRRDVVTWLWVAANRRRRGIAARLLRALESAARSRGIRVLWATARSPEFFLSRGFTPVRRGAGRKALLASCRGCKQRGKSCRPEVVSKRPSAGVEPGL
jgi:molybdopterin-guanine dinucleotide biosynthesis protein A/N-acetylglutamate synthase-like GNAT family acetyltransferase